MTNAEKVLQSFKDGRMTMGEMLSWFAANPTETNAEQRQSVLESASARLERMAGNNLLVGGKLSQVACGPRARQMANALIA